MKSLILLLILQQADKLTCFTTNSFLLRRAKLATVLYERKEVTPFKLIQKTKNRKKCNGQEDCAVF